MLTKGGRGVGLEDRKKQTQFCGAYRWLAAKEQGPTTWWHMLAHAAACASVCMPPQGARKGQMGLQVSAHTSSFPSLSFLWCTPVCADPIRHQHPEHTMQMTGDLGLFLLGLPAHSA
uniref:Uncharacterized protein n=1 Tax=Eutreptiella gymnastica TaxID=73025 RepID=A0A7S1ID39_9EUGL